MSLLVFHLVYETVAATNHVVLFELLVKFFVTTQEFDVLWFEHFIVFLDEKRFYKLKFVHICVCFVNDELID